MYTWTFIASNPKEPKFTTKTIKELREKLQIGDKVSFIKTKLNAMGNSTTQEIHGVIKAKYPYIFQLTNGETYTYVDYMLGTNI